MAKRQRLLTEFTSRERTAQIIEEALHQGVEAASPDSPIASLTVKQVAELAALTLFVLGEVYEKQFYPSDRAQCQEVGGELLRRVGLPAPAGLMLPA